MSKPSNQKLAWITLVLLILYVGLFFLQKINLHTADIGRHVMNGQVIREEGLKSKVLSTNYYSATQSDFPFINHHWLYGVWAYWVQIGGGWAGLVIANALLAMLAIGIMAIFSARQTSPAATAFALFITLPLLTQRTEARPETWSLLFLSLSFISIWLWLAGKLKTRFLFIFQVIISILWVNFHLFFVFNLFLLGCAFLARWSTYLWTRFKRSEQQFPSQDRSHFQHSIAISLILLATLIILFFNPNVLFGVLAPFQIFNNYAYPVAENQSVWFYIMNFPNRLHFWYGLGLISILIGCLLWWWRPKNPDRYQNYSQPLLLFATITTLGLIILGLSVVRVLPFLALLAIPVFAITLNPYLPKLHNFLSKLPSVGYAVLSSILIVLLMLMLATGIFLPFLPNSGIGLLTNSLASGEFMRSASIPGPMFNNYDAGGYLINQLFTTNPNSNLPRVFVDNRPEAYPGDFILNDLIQAQKDESDWQRILAKYDFQSIVFYRHDATDWGQPFLIRRVNDEKWVPIYVDEYAVILIRNLPQNQSLIDQYQLPPETFVVNQNT